MGSSQQYVDKERQNDQPELIKPRYSFQFKGSRPDKERKEERYDELNHTFVQSSYSPRFTEAQVNNPPELVFQNNGDAKNIKMWGIKFFGDKDSMPVGDFLFRVEALRMRNNLNIQQIPENFHILVGGKADAFYWQLYRTNYNKGLELGWEEIKKEFTKQFQPKANEFAIMKELMNLKQEKEESFDQLYSRFCQIHNQLESPLNEVSIVDLLRSSLRDELDQLTFAAEIDDIDQLRDLVQKAETRTNKVKKTISQTPFRKISEIKKPASSNLQSNSSRHNKSVMCWNCGEQGHGFMVCDKERTIFCYKCGKKNVTVPRCGRCYPGNQVANGNQTGQSHLPTISPARINQNQ